LGFALVAACKAQLGDGPNADATSTDGTPSRDAPGDSGLGAWSTPQVITGADLGNAANVIDDPTVSSNGLELIFSLGLAGANYNYYVMTRGSTSSPWGTPAAITELASTTSEISPRLSLDDLTLYFSRGGQIYTATRTAIGQPWTNIAPLAAVNTGANQKWMTVCNGGYFVLSRALAGTTTSFDFYQGQLGNGAGTLVTELSSPYADAGAHLSPDCLTIYFASNRADHTNAEIYTATRATVGGTWTTPTLVNDFNAMGASQDDPFISNDQRLFVFSRYSTGVPNQLYQSTR
jgi:hypothetical protein